MRRPRPRPTRPAVDEMFTIEPPPALRISGIAYLVPRKTPVALTDITSFHSSRVVSSIGTVRYIPALFTRTSSFPNLWAARATAFFQSSSLLTSSFTKRARPPASFTSASILRPSSTSTSPMTTLAPSLAKSLASAAPIPRAPPLMIATLPPSLIAIFYLPFLACRPTPKVYCPSYSLPPCLPEIKPLPTGRCDHRLLRARSL